MAPPKLVNLAPAVSTDICRWCFHHWQIEHEESLHVPVFHVFALLWYRTSNGSRPVVRHDGLNYRTEPHILWHFEPQVAPERRLIPEGKLGEAVMAERDFYHYSMRRGTVAYMYWNLLQNRDLVWKGFTTGVPGYEVTLASLSWGFIRWGLIKGLDLSEANASAGLDKVRAGFDRAEALLADGRPYLCGDRFTAADMAFAAGAAPIVLDPGYGGNLPTFEEVPEHMQTVISEFRARPAKDFIRRMYRDHRES